MRNVNKPNVVIDTNLFISGMLFIRGGPFELLEKWRRNQYKLLISQPLLEELTDVLSRPKFQKYYFSEKRIQRILSLLLKHTQKVTVFPDIPVTVRDPKDTIVLAAAIGGNADYLVTGDEDLLILNGKPELKKLRIVTVKYFLDTITV